MGRKDWQTKAQNVDFFTIKGLLENLFEQLGITEDVHYQTVTEMKEMHPGRTAAIYLGEKFIGFVGQVHPTITKVMIFQKHMLLSLIYLL